MSNIDTISQPAPLPEDPNDANGTNGTTSNDTWSDSREQLKKIVGDVHQTTIESAERLTRIIQADVFETLLETFTKASAVHIALGDEIKHAIESGVALPWYAVLKYRRGAQERVLSPINARLGIQVSEQVYKSFLKLFSELEAGVADLPATLSIPEPPSLYQPKDADPLWTRIKKAQVRSNRRMAGLRAGVKNGLRHLIGRAKIHLDAPRLEVDLNMLLGFHVKVRIPEASTQEFNTIHSFLSAHIAAYEKAQTTWTYELLDIEQSLSTPFHELEELDIWLPDEEQTSQPIKPDEANRLLSAVNLLQACLDQIVAHPLPAPELDSELLDACANALYQDFKCGDSFLLDDRSIPETTSLTASLLEKSTTFWKTWYREVSDRINMNSRLLELRDFLIKREKSLLNSIAKASIIPILNSFGRLRSTFADVSKEVDEICEAPDSTDVSAEVLAKLQPLHQQISAQFKHILNDVTNLLRAGQALEEPGAIFWNDLHRFIDGLPELVDVHETLRMSVSPTESAKQKYQIRLREIVQSALLKPLSKQLSSSAKSLQKAVINTWEETQQVEYMVDYNLKAAFAELKNEKGEQEVIDALSSTQRIEESTGHDPVEVARELITTGLSRSTEKLGELAKGLKKPWNNLADQTFIAVEAYSDDILHNILEEDNMTARWTNFTMKVNRSIKKLGQLGEQGFNQLNVYAGKVIKLGRRRTKQLIKKGQTAVGVVDQSEDQWLHTLELASDIDALHKRLPLVYRRLFSLKPLADLDLLEGRKLDVAFVKKHYGQWRNTQTGPLLLAMPDGSGRTSFMNVLISSIFDDANVQPINLSRRVPDEAAFARQVAAALSLPADESLTMDKLELQIMAMKRGKTPCILVIDRFEHLMLCSPGGHNLVERVLIFMSRTDNYIYWVINVSTHAWHFLEKTMSPSSGFISAYKVTNLQRQALEDIILKRHQRSGMTLYFRSNVSSNNFFDFSRSKSEESLQEMHRTAFFDRLYRLSGENILLALLYWLRAVEFDTEEDTLFVNAIQPINFSFLDTLDLPRAFTLKSFLTHGTLTLQEHMRVFKLNQNESTFILESLLNLHIIEPSMQDPDESIHFRIENDLPYRLHPLIVYPVLELLKKKHIVY